jgi:hypothetical protein
MDTQTTLSSAPDSSPGRLLQPKAQESIARLWSPLGLGDVVLLAAKRLLPLLREGLDPVLEVGHEGDQALNVLLGHRLVTIY